MRLTKANSINPLQLPHKNSVSNFKAENILLNGVTGNGANLHGALLLAYTLDCSQNRYCCLDAPGNTALGFSKVFLEAAGPQFFKNLIHASDLKIYTSSILPTVIYFLSKHETIHQTDFSFSYNYRIKTREGNYLTVLQRSEFLLAESTNHLLAEKGYVVDITHFKEDTKIIFTIEQTICNETGLHKNIVQKTIFFPQLAHKLFSRREQEILALIYKGSGSKQIAECLSISINTINNHRKSMLNKTGSKNCMQLLNYAIQHGIIN